MWGQITSCWDSREQSHNLQMCLWWLEQPCIDGNTAPFVCIISCESLNNPVRKERRCYWDPQLADRKLRLEKNDLETEIYLWNISHHQACYVAPWRQGPFLDKSIPLVLCFIQWCPGKYLTTSSLGKRKSRICSICQFLKCKYSHHSPFWATHGISTTCKIPENLTIVSY